MFPPIGGKVYVDNNQDRFGRPILPRKPRELIPGPGEYALSDINDPIMTKGGFIAQAPLFDPASEKKGIPGPAFYNASMEPKKISFLFNAAEKWTA